MTLEGRLDPLIRLREADHRYANSLLLLRNLARRKLRDAREPETREALTYLGEMIEVLGSLHRTTCQGDAHDISERLREVGQHWQRLCNGHIEIVVAAEPGIRTPDRTIVDLVIVTQELVVNAIKHAFPDSRTGTIRIELRREGAEHAILSVSDDGVGLSAASPGAGDTAHRGLGLISLIAANLGAKLDQGPNGGTGHEVTLRLPIERKT